MIKFQPMTRQEIALLEKNDKQAMPNGFTGKWRGRYFYKGQLWNHPATNTVGMAGLRRAALVLLLTLIASVASAKGKSRYQFDVCFLDHGKVAVVGTSDRQAQALAVASFLDESKADHGAHHFVVVEELDKNGDVK